MTSKNFTGDDQLQRWNSKAMKIYTLPFITDIDSYSYFTLSSQVEYFIIIW